jgi:hypothetical protein
MVLRVRQTLLPALEEKEVIIPDAAAWQKK